MTVRVATTDDGHADLRPSSRRWRAGRDWLNAFRRILEEPHAVRLRRLETFGVLDGTYGIPGSKTLQPSVAGRVLAERQSSARASRRRIRARHLCSQGQMLSAALGRSVAHRAGIPTGPVWGPDNRLLRSLGAPPPIVAARLGFWRPGSIQYRSRLANTSNGPRVEARIVACSEVRSRPLCRPANFRLSGRQADLGPVAQ